MTKLGFFVGEHDRRSFKLAPRFDASEGGEKRQTIERPHSQTRAAVCSLFYALFLRRAVATKKIVEQRSVCKTPIS